MIDFWNARYASDAYAYGEQPNAYFKAVVDTLSPGRMLVPGAGEGRDAIYAASFSPHDPSCLSTCRRAINDNVMLREVSSMISASQRA